MTASVTPLLPSGSNPTEEQWGIKPGAKSASQRRDIGLLVDAACKGAPSLQLSTAQSTQQVALQVMANASAADRAKAGLAGAASKERAQQLKKELVQEPREKHFPSREELTRCLQDNLSHEYMREKRIAERIAPLFADSVKTEETIQREATTFMLDVLRRPSMNRLTPSMPVTLALQMCSKSVKPTSQP